MSNENTSTIRWQLLSTVSAIALLASAYAAGEAEAAGNDADHPMLWIELGGQMENVGGQGEVFTPAFLSKYSSASVLQATTPLQAQKPPKFSFGEEGKISFQPEGSDWVFSAAARIGRSSNFRHVDHQTNHILQETNTAGFVGIYTTANFADTHAEHRESHAILDFSAGKDVGLGLFGNGSSSVLSAGVRFAQFTSKATFDIRARPDLHIKYVPSAAATTKIPLKYFHTYHATGYAERSFRGVGPSLSWNGSALFVGAPQDGEMTFDWGVNASVLFGKQKAHVQHLETAHYKSKLSKYYAPVYPPRPGGRDTVRSVTVPNVGGFVGVSWHVQDFKVSLGYHVDFFVGAIDGGIDTRKSETLAFKGPYASISVGLGD
jgi:iron complex outermembrane recepter protein